MHNFVSFIKKHQQKIALVLGYLLIAGLFFNLGRISERTSPPEISIEEPSISPSEVYDTLKNAQAQFVNSGGGDVAGEATDNCQGKIKGNIGSSGMIYHLPGGAFYNRTDPEACFDTEAEAQAAGFRKSQR